jgi:homospermidine synthase
VEEGQAPAELGWGTHEKELPYDAITHDKEGPKNQICLQTKGIDALVRSFVPSGPIIGMVIRHGESFSIRYDNLAIADTPLSIKS